MSPGEKVTVEVEGKELVLSNLDKVLYPKTGFTKADLISYYSKVAPAMLPHLAGRPVTVLRFPDGVDGGGFFAKNVPKGAPPWLQSIEVKSGARGGPDSTRYPLVDGLPALIYLVNLAAIEVHVPMWHLPLDHGEPNPDELVFDLDPGPPAGLTECCVVALELRERLEARRLTPVAKVSGKKGLQLYCPVRPMAAEAARTMALDLAEEFASARPDLAVTNMRKELRRGKVLIDWSQNVPAKTTVAPYSLRAEESPSVSTPLRWEEVEGVANGAPVVELRFAPDQVLQRVEAEGDLFSPLLQKRR